MALEESLRGASLAVLLGDIWNDCDKDRDGVLKTVELSYFIKVYLYLTKLEKDDMHRQVKTPNFLQFLQEELSSGEDLARAEELDTLLGRFGRDPQPVLHRIRELYGNGPTDPLTKDKFLNNAPTVLIPVLKDAKPLNEDSDSSESEELTNEEIANLRRRMYGKPALRKSISQAPRGMKSISSKKTSQQPNYRPRNSQIYKSPNDHQHQPSQKRAAEKKKKKKKGQRHFPSNELQGKYEFVKYLGHGSYGHVCEARSLKDGSKVALKKVGKIFGNIIDAKRFLREIYILRLMKNHEAIVDLSDILPPPNSHRDFNTLYLVFEYVDTDLHHLIGTNQFFSSLHCQYMLYQVILALHFMHSGGMVHRDIKPANILINEDCSVKLCDFGLARGFNEEPQGNKSAQTQKNLTIPANKNSTAEGGEAGESKKKIHREVTRHIVTRWYRAPEVILITQNRKYLTAIDMWSIGCIMSELLQMIKQNIPNPENREPLFPGKSCFPLSAKDPFAYQDRMDQLNVIFEVIGTPSEQTIEECCNEQCHRYLKSLRKKPPMDLSTRFPGVSPQALDLLFKLLNFDYRERYTAEQALNHPYFKDVRDPEAEARHVAEVFDFEDIDIDIQTIRNLILREVSIYNPEYSTN